MKQEELEVKSARGRILKMENKLIKLVSEEERMDRMREECIRISRNIDDIASDPTETDAVIIRPISEGQAKLIMSQLTPTFWADCSFKFGEYAGQVNIYNYLKVKINRNNLAA